MAELDIDRLNQPALNIDETRAVTTRWSQLLSQVFPVTWERLLVGFFVGMAVVSRLWSLGARVTSHDESLHTYYSWLLATGKGFAHNPMMHGPCLFDLIVSTWILEHLPDPVLVVEKAYVWLKPGGHIVLLFEDQSSSLTRLVVDKIYSLMNAHLVQEAEYRRFPGTVVAEKHFSGPSGDVAVFVLEKPW